MDKWWKRRQKALHRIKGQLQNERKELAKHGYTISQVNDAEELLGLAEEIAHHARRRE